MTSECRERSRVAIHALGAIGAGLGTARTLEALGGTGRRDGSRWAGLAETEITREGTSRTERTRRLVGTGLRSRTTEVALAGARQSRDLGDWALLALAINEGEGTRRTERALGAVDVGLGAARARDARGGTGVRAHGTDGARLAQAIAFREEARIAELAARERAVGLASRRAQEALERGQAVGDGARGADAATGAVGRVVARVAWSTAAPVVGGREARSALVAARAREVGHLAVGAWSAGTTGDRAVTTIARVAVEAQDARRRLRRGVLDERVTVVGRARGAELLGSPAGRRARDDVALVAAHEAHKVELEERRAGEVIGVDERPAEPDDERVGSTGDERVDAADHVGDHVALDAGVEHRLVREGAHRVDGRPAGDGRRRRDRRVGDGKGELASVRIRRRVVEDREPGGTHVERTNDGRRERTAKAQRLRP